MHGEKYLFIMIIGSVRTVSDVISREGISEQLDMDVALTLILLGDQDVATVLHKTERINGRIQHSKFLVIPNAGHTATLEETQAIMLH